LSNIVIVNGSSYATPYVQLAEELGLKISTNKDLILECPEEVSLVVFTGGADVSPDLYREEKHRSTGNRPDRDKEEMNLFFAAKKAGIPMAGICRGSQFLCAMAGGKVVQDVTNHLGNHNIAVSMPDGTIREVEVTSTHHQMQYPFNMPSENYEVIGWTPVQRSKHYAMNPVKVITAEDADDNLKSEPDIVWYPKIKALAAQYHPEFMPTQSEGFQLYLELLDAYIKPEVIQHVFSKAEHAKRSLSEQDRKGVTKALS
jgi:gamma-glutamyl-gamma-aminobutyrate hydrolase PuuD